MSSRAFFVIAVAVTSFGIFAPARTATADSSCLLNALLGTLHEKLSERRKPIFTAHWSDWEAQLRARLQELGYKGNKVVIRFFTLSRIAQTLKTGSDRDSTSRLFDMTPVDSDAQARKAAGIPNSAVTYALTLDLSRSPALTESLNGAEGAISSSELSDQNQHFDMGLAVYDPGKITRASEAEYWFRSNPRESLIFVMRIRQDHPNLEENRMNRLNRRRYGGTP